jgi:phenol 2-monooxygenase
VRNVGQPYVAHLTLGERLPPARLVRAADARPLDIQDLCLADTRFKLFVFTGAEPGRAEMQTLVEDMIKEGALVRKIRESGMLDIVAVCRGKKDVFNWTDMPAALRVHWTKYVLPMFFFLACLPRPFHPCPFVFVVMSARTDAFAHRVLLDDTDVQGNGGAVYATYGVPEAGALAVVRPDGYVGALAPLSTDGLASLETYFAGFAQL